MAWNLSCTQPHRNTSPDRPGFRPLPSLDLSQGNTPITYQLEGNTAECEWEDDYDPRKPQYVVQASAQEAAETEASLLRLQMAHLESMLARRREDCTSKNVINHYETILEEMSRIAETKSCSPRSVVKCMMLPTGERKQRSFNVPSFCMPLSPADAKRRNVESASKPPKRTSSKQLSSPVLKPSAKKMSSPRPTSPTCRTPHSMPASPAASEGRASLPRDGGMTHLMSSRRDMASIEKRAASSHPIRNSTTCHSQPGVRRGDASVALPPCRPVSAGKAVPASTTGSRSPARTPQSQSRLMSATAPARSFASMGAHRNFSHSSLNRSGRAVVAL